MVSRDIDMTTNTQRAAVGFFEFVARNDAAKTNSTALSSQCSSQISLRHNAYPRAGFRSDLMSPSVMSVVLGALA
jgi:hypothetical protein